MLPFSDAKEGPLADLTKSGRSFFPTWAKGVEQTAGVGRDVVSQIMGEVKVAPFSFDPVVVNAPERADRARAAHAAPSITFAPGAFNITIGGNAPLTDLEDQLTQIFARAATNMGGA